MDAREHLRSGDVQGALAALKQEVRRSPGDAKLRIFLFQMFCIEGAWDRALTQLAAVSELDKMALPMVQTYEVAIRSELLRERVFRGERTPMVLGEPGEWLPLLIEAARQLAAGKTAAAARLRDAAFEQAPASPGTADAAAFEWFADADPRLGPVLEAIIDGKYYWIPVSAVRRMEVDAPADLRDKVWMPVRFRWINGGESVGLMPTRYPGSAAASDPLVQLAQRTEWEDRPDGWSLPMGQRMFGTEAGEIPLMDLRVVEFAAAGTAADAAARP